MGQMDDCEIYPSYNLDEIESRWGDSTNKKSVLAAKTKIRQCAILGANWNLQWSGGEKETFKNIYQIVKRRSEKDVYVRGIWASSILKMSLSLWRLRWDHLHMFLRIRQWGRVTPNYCILCSKVEETTKHLFFSWDYSKQILQKISDTMVNPIEIVTNIQHICDSLENFTRGAPL